MNIIVAVSCSQSCGDWGIGYRGNQSVVVPEDREFFREVTTGGIVIVGRKTFESIGRPLPNRKNIILTNNKNYEVPGAAVVHSAGQVFEKIPRNCMHKVFVIGGAEIYKQFLPLCSYAYVTKCYVETEADKYFPNLDTSPDWIAMDMEEIVEIDDYRLSFNLYKAAALC